jgi:pimeloyl-ACP methyl ester carboxylesterase
MSTMQGVIPEARSTRLHFKINGYLAVCLAMLLLLAVASWMRPFWIIDRATEVRLAVAGMHSEDAIVDGYKIHYLVGGTGEPIVLVHGLGSRASDWVGLIPSLVHSGHRVYALDLLGYGDSERPANSQYSIQQEARIVEDFLQEQHLQHVDLAGWSMGGWISMVVARDIPQHISKLILLDSAGVRFQPTFDPLLFTPTDLEQLHQLERLQSPSAPAMPTFLARAFLVRAQPEAWVIRRSVDSMLTGQDLMDQNLGDLTMPVLIVWGKQDMLTPLSLAYEIHGGIPNSQLEVFDGCGHLAPGLCAGRIAPSIVHFLDHSATQQEAEQQHASVDARAVPTASLAALPDIRAGLR